MICVKKFKRLESIRGLVYDMILTSNNSAVKKQEAYAHLFQVSTSASILAVKRGENSEIAAIAGFLHGYYFYKTGIKEFPGPNSAETVRPIIRDTQMFTDEEQVVILRSIFYQEDRYRVHGPYEEIIKDAILFHMYFQNTVNTPPKSGIHRLQKVFIELGIPDEYVKAESRMDSHPSTTNRNAEDRRLMMADFAEKFARKNIIGESENEHYREICKYWPDADIYKVLKGNWCAAFVYNCCMQTGILMPIRYPNSTSRFAGVGAWLEWAKLPETSFFYQDKQDGLTPQRGDIVIYEQLLSEDSHDHIGIVLDCDDNRILVAEGNKDNLNYSSVFYRNRGHCILGYIRIDNTYHFHFNGEYMSNPQSNYR